MVIVGATHTSAKKIAHRSVEPSAEGRAHEIDDIEPRLFKDPLGVAHTLEAFLTVIRAHPAGANAAKRHVVLRIVQKGVVDADTAGRRALDDLTSRRAIRTEEV